MIHDKNLMFFDAAKATAAAAVQIDAAGTDIGNGEPMYLFVAQKAAKASASTTFALTTSDTETGGDDLLSITLKQTGKTEIACVSLPMGVDYKKYLVLTPTGGSGTCTAGLTRDPQVWRAYPAA
jgi:hypothetical protein